MPRKKTTNRKQSKQRQQTGSTVKKGKIVEKITAAFHENPDVTVRLNVFLPVLGTGKRRREIDVLVVGQVAGYSKRIAFECKNERSSVGVQKIDEFIGKLKDVGIPPQDGVYVSASGYTQGAIERAHKEGLKTLTLEGLTKEGLSAILHEAFQAVVFLMGEITQFTIEYDEETGCSDNPYMFFNERGEFYTFLHDFLWDAWLTGQLPLIIGTHSYNVKLPQKLYQFVDKKLKSVRAVTIKSMISGLVIHTSGKGEQLLLRDASTKAIERTTVKIKFDTSKKQYPATLIQSEKELDSFLERLEPFRIVTRVRLPRIRTDRGVYWPPSDRIVSVLMQRHRAYQMGEISELSFDDLGEIEGSELNGAWESISERYIAARQYWRSTSESKKSESEKDE